MNCDIGSGSTVFLCDFIHGCGHRLNFSICVNMCVNIQYKQYNYFITFLTCNIFVIL